MYFESFAHVPVTEELLRHVWEGEEDPSKGGHRYGLHRLHKTEFPQHWELVDVEKAIRLTLTKPQYITHKTTAIYCDREVKGVVVRVVITFASGLSIRSAYPLCGFGVFRNEAHGRTALSLDFYNWEE